MGFAKTNKPSSFEGKKRPASSHGDGDFNFKKKNKVQNGTEEIAKPNTKMNRKEQKAMAKERKARSKKNFNLIQDVTEKWELLRRHDTTPARCSELVTEILEKIKGRIAELAGSHTASRAVQACVKHGTAKERQQILQEITPTILQLSKSPYGRFVVSKLITMTPKEQIPNLLKAFKGHAAELLRHPAGTHVLDDLYSISSAAQRNALASEFYGREYSLFSDGTLNNTQGAPPKLRTLLEAVDGAKQRSIIQFLATSISPVIEKGLVDCQLSHRLLAEYLQEAPGSLVADAVESLSGDALLHMMHTHQGAAVASMVLSYGTAKDRKKAIKSMKGHVVAGVRDEWGHLVFVTALNVVDDTALLQKVIITEIEKELAVLVADKYGHRVLLQLLHPDHSKYLPPTLATIVHPQEKYTTVKTLGGDDDDDDEEEEEEKQEEEDKIEDESTPPGEQKQIKLGVSKKDPNLRRKELFQGGCNLGKALTKLCTESASEMIVAQYTADVMIEVMSGSKDGVLEEVVGADEIDNVHSAVIEAAKKGIEEEDRGVLGSYFGSRALKRLILSSKTNSDMASTRFVESLWENVVRGKCSVLHSTHAAKVLAALMYSGSPAVVAGVKKEMKKVVGDVNEWGAKFVTEFN